jgi:hypothetical protein
MFHELEVRAGIALLDREEPGWRRHIDVERLSLDHTVHCVLSQIQYSQTRPSGFVDAADGYYRKASKLFKEAFEKELPEADPERLIALDERSALLASHGFTLYPTEMNPWADSDSWMALTDTWRAILAEDPAVEESTVLDGTRVTVETNELRLCLKEMSIMAMGRRAIVEYEEQSAYTGWRRVVTWTLRPGKVKSVKRRTHRRERHEAKQQIREEISE